MSVFIFLPQIIKEKGERIWENLTLHLQQNKDSQCALPFYLYAYIPLYVYVLMTGTV